MPPAAPPPPSRPDAAFPASTPTSGRTRSRRGSPNALDAIRTAFSDLTAGENPLAVDGRLFAGWPPRPIPLDEVRDRLLDRSCPQAIRDAVWAHLVVRARTDAPAWAVGAAGVALPGLTGCAARLTARFAGDPADVHAEVVAGFLAALHRVDIGRPRIMARLRWAAYRAGHAALLEALRAPRPAGLTHGQPVLPATGSPDEVLARAVAAGAITDDDAELIGATRLEDTAVDTWAEQHHASSRWAVYKARRRAEARLRDYVCGARPGRPVRGSRP